MKSLPLIAAVYLILVLECFASSPARQVDAHPDGYKVEVRREVYLMGTRASLHTYAADRETGLIQIENFLRILEDTEMELSTWRSDSVISRLNRSPVGASFPLEASLCRLFVELRAWTEITGSAFDPAVGTLTKAWGLHSGGHRPTAAELQIGLDNAGFQHLDLDAQNCIVVKLRSTLIDVGAFGKGDALDRVLDYSSDAEFAGWMIDLGGQIIVHGTPPDAEFWSLDLAHPLHRTESVLTIQLSEGSLATSGGSERDVGTGNRRIGHILDPRTGQPVQGNVAIAVWHQRPLVADILSTALYVMGPDRGLAWAERNDVVATFLISDDRGHVEIRATHLFEEKFLLN